MPVSAELAEDVRGWFEAYDTAMARMFDALVYPRAPLPYDHSARGPGGRVRNRAWQAKVRTLHRFRGWRDARIRTLHDWTARYVGCD